MIVSRYVRRSAFFAMSTGVLGLWLLQIIFAYLSELENLSDTYQLGDALWYVLYRAPYFFVQFAPTGVLLGAVVGLGLLAANSELVVMRAAGISLYRIIGWVMVPALLFVLLSLTINQWLLPISNTYAKNLGKPSHDIISIRGYWTVVNTPSNANVNTQDVIYVNYADNKGMLGNIRRYRIQDGALISVIHADTGTYIGSQDGNYRWRMNKLHGVIYDGARLNATTSSNDLLSLPIAPESVHLLTKEPDDLSLSDLYVHKRLMRHQGTRSLRHELAFWQKLFSPFAVLSLVLVACSFVFGSLRSQSLGLRIVLALLTGLLFSYLSDLSGFVALATGWSPLIMALLPVLISFVAGWYLLKRQG